MMEMHLIYLRGKGSQHNILLIVTYYRHYSLGIVLKIMPPRRQNKDDKKNVHAFNRHWQAPITKRIPIIIEKMSFHEKYKSLGASS